MSRFLRGHERSTWGAGRAVSWRVVLRRVSGEISWGNNNRKRGVAQTRSTLIWQLCLDFLSPRLCCQSQWRHIVSAVSRSATSRIKSGGRQRRKSGEDVTQQRGPAGPTPAFSFMRVSDEQRNQRDHLVGLFVRFEWTGWTISRVACGSIPEPSEGRDPSYVCTVTCVQRCHLCVQSKRTRRLWNPLFKKGTLAAQWPNST